MIDEILDYNRQFVANGGYEPFATSKFPDKKVAIVGCMDTRLSLLLPAALGLKNGDAKIITTAGAQVLTPFDGVIRSLLIAIYELGVTEIMVIAHTDCGACHLSGEEMCHLMTQRGITAETLAVLRNSGKDVAEWLEGFHDTPAAVRRSVAMITAHPLVPKDVRVEGFIIDTATGALARV